MLREERDLLQNQVWELLQQLENLNPQLPVSQAEVEEETEEFPFDDLVEAIVIEPAEKTEVITIESAEKTANKPEELTEEWKEFLQNLPEHEIKVLKIILKQVRVKSSIKKIAEQNITMPNLLIDSINGRAQNAVGELIISTDNDIPEVYEEYLENIQKIIDISEEKVRLEKSLGKLAKELGGLRGRLNNPKFAASAPAEVVEETRANLALREEEEARLNAALARLAELG